ncbi:sensor histidine kinase [Oxalobacteraceae bacterium OM1]|nr:sensor histidine kinase [Oxalobacteraceae bacterium OM1]
MSELAARWFSGAGFMPLADCYRWLPELLWTYLLSDSAIGLAFYSIPIALVYFMRKRRDLRIHWILVLFAVFFFVAGSGHLLSAWTTWHPDFWLEAPVQAIVAVMAVVTAALLWSLMPKALKIPSHEQLQQAIRQLEHEVAERKNAELALRESQALLRELAAYQERIREDERKRIAREIHDELGQNLLALRLDVSALHAYAGDRYPRLRKRAGNALEYIDTTMKSIRTIMNNLRPSVLDLGLHAAIEWQVRQFERRSSVACELVMDDNGIPIDEPQATAVFRILQESLTNVGRHARATFVRIELRVDHEKLTLAIQDNGVGMYPGDRRKVHRFGLIGIEERVTMLGGSLKIDSTPGQGTVLNLSVPLHSTAAEQGPAPKASAA